jgi:hypothetical protein
VGLVEAYPGSVSWIFDDCGNEAELTGLEMALE